MSDRTPVSASGARELPDSPSLEWLRKQAKRLLRELQVTDPAAKLAAAQFALAKAHGFTSWRALEAYIESLTIEGRAFEMARAGDAVALRTLLDANPSLLHAREKPYAWTLLHAAAQKGQLDVVDLLLSRGLDPNTRERGDDSYAMHWAAAHGHLAVVRRLADAGGDVVGRGDDHELEVIGWASVWDGCDDAAHREVADFLVSRGARHHVFSAISHDLADEVRRIVHDDPASLERRMSRNENHRTPLQLAVLRNRPEMAALLLELGADPFAVDGGGQSVAVYASVKDADRPVMETICRRTMATPGSTRRGEPLPLVACLSLAEWDTAARLVRDDASLLGRGALHILAKRGDAPAVRWLLDQGADPNSRWMHWDAEVTPLHLTAFSNDLDTARALLAAGADPRIRDGKHDSDAIGWAEFFGRTELRDLLEARYLGAR
jgi:ankyrin repeat protein